MSGLPEMTLDGFLDLVPGYRANYLLGYLSALEDEQRRDAANVELACGIRVFINIEFYDFDFAGISGGDLGDGGRKHQAGPAPLRPKIHHYRLSLAGVDDLGLKSAIRHIINIFCHEFPFVLEAAWSY